MALKGKADVIHPAPDDMEIAPGYRVSDWKSLNLAAPDCLDWEMAIRIFDTRIRRRFIDPVDVLIEHENGQERGSFGFAILAIDCLLIETLQGFYEGLISHNGESKRLVCNFLEGRWPDIFNDGYQGGSRAERFYSACRCGIHHSGQTDGDFRVRRSGPLIEFRQGGSVAVNRTALHDRLKQELDSYLDDLAVESSSELREKFKTKMDAICGIQAKPTGVAA